ncbi:Pathogenesis-related homeodomain protein-like protein [Drosera capensis]
MPSGEPIDDPLLSKCTGDVDEVGSRPLKRRRKKVVRNDNMVEDDRPFASLKDSEEAKSGKLRRRRKRKGKNDNDTMHEAAKLQRRARYLLVKMKLEQNLIDAYSGEGWKGQSREKIRPEKELHRARSQIVKCKLGIRDIVRQLEMLSSVGKIEESLIAPDGSVHHEHIYCAKCSLQDVSQDNDIILCDGTCSCAFHQKCLDPPLETENIPPEEEGWFCRYCECKMEILDAMNAHLGTEFVANCSWENIFREEASLPDNEMKLLNPDEEWPDDDSEDNDYDPEREENDGYRPTIGVKNSEDGRLGSTSSSLGSSSDGDTCVESGSSENESMASKNCSSKDYTVARDPDEQTDHEIVSGPRRRDAVDYREMFGKHTAESEEVSEDEDWGPSRKRRRKKACDASNTLMALGDAEKRHSGHDVGTESLQNSRCRKLRIPVSSVEKLREVFVENELPTKAVKQLLSQQLGLEYEKVSKWFKNSRYAALKTRKVDVLEESRSPPSTGFNKPSTEAAGDVMSESMKALHKIEHMKRVGWKANIKSLVGPLKLQRQKRAVLSSPCLVEPTDDVSLKQLLQLKRTYRKAKNPVLTVNCFAEEDGNSLPDR